MSLILYGYYRNVQDYIGFSLQAKGLAIELFKWIRDAIRPQLANIKPVQVKQLYFSKRNFGNFGKKCGCAMSLFEILVGLVIKIFVTHRKKSLKEQLQELFITLVKS